MHASRPIRKTLRLRDFDYASEGAYFVTICTHQRRSIFGQIKNDEMCPSRLGAAVRDILFSTALRLGIVVDTFVLMPNHLHAVLFITGGPRVRTGYIGNTMDRID